MEFAIVTKCRLEIRVKHFLNCYIYLVIHLTHWLHPLCPSCHQQEEKKLSGMLGSETREGTNSSIGLVLLLRSSKGSIILFLVTLPVPLASRNHFSFSLPGSVIFRTLFANTWIHLNYFNLQASCQLFFSCFLGKGLDIFIFPVFVAVAKYLTLPSLMLMW